MRISLCQLDPTVGDLARNVDAMLAAAERAKVDGARVVIFPELAIVGYPAKDLLDRPSFIDAILRAKNDFVARMPKGLVGIFGFVDRAAGGAARLVHNSVGVCENGALLQTVHKRLLPTYDVFDDDRYFEPGRGAGVISVDGVKLGITICEDIWNDIHVDESRRYPVNPVDDVVAAGAEIIVNIAASPFTLTKRQLRKEMLASVAKKHARPVLFVNQVGGFDDLIFDGSSSAWNERGELVARAKEFAEDQIQFQHGISGTIRDHVAGDAEAALEALILGTRDYAHKCGFKKAVLGLSGGIDSALVAAIAAAALGKENVLGIALPTRYSSDHSRNDARALAEALGIAFREIPIDGIFQAYIDELTEPLNALGAASANDVTFENIQSRIRCGVLMSVSNRDGHLLLTTGNKSEVAVGYCTLYGDMAGGLAVISDLPKTFVYEVARAVNARAGAWVIPESTMTKAPSAELRPNQVDQDSLPPYDLLDAILERYVEDARSADSIIAEGFDAAVVQRVVKLVTMSEYKRQQMPPGLIITRKAFGSGRRYPLAAKWRS